MADKVSTIILKVDLDCRRCYKKISKAICKLQERENIQTVAFDDKNNTVAISGPFDPKKLIQKLCCKAGDVIKDIQIKEKEKDKPKDEKPKPKDDKPKDDKPKPKDEKPKDEDDKPKPKDDKPKDEKPKPKDDKPKDERPLPGPGCSCGCHPWPGPGCSCGRHWPGPGCTCGCRPWHYGDYKCPWCGREYGWVPPVYAYGTPYGGYKTCHITCEEDPQSSCGVM